MPYKDPEHKRQWEREHRELRNARRRKQRMAAGSGQPAAPRSSTDIAAALGSLRMQPTGPVSGRKPQGTWNVIVGWALGIGVVLLGAFAGASGLDTGTHGSGKMGKNPSR